MKIGVFKTKNDMGKAAAEEAARILIDTIREKGEATFINPKGRIPRACPWMNG